MKKLILLILVSFFIAGCGSSSRFSDETTHGNKKSKYDKRKPVKVVKVPEEIPEDEYKNAEVLESQTGVASYYSDKFDGKKTSSGEIYSKNGLTGAHLKYPYNTILRIINLLNNKSAIIRINDRKPDFNGRIIDVSYGAAKKLEMISSGISEVKIEVLKWGEKK